MAIYDYEHTLVQLFQLMVKGNDEHAHILMPTQPLDRDLPEHHYWVSNFTEGSGSDRVTVSQESLNKLEQSVCIEHPYIKEDRRNPFTLSPRGIEYATRVAGLINDSDGRAEA